MGVEELPLILSATVLVGLRIGPTFAFAPPFTLMRVPPLVRVLLAFALALALVDGHRETALAALREGRPMVSLMLGELVVGIGLSLALQIAFAAILWAGRAVDIQAGFGLAALADPVTEAQMPLAGTLFAYAAALIFFTMGGPYDLLALWAASLQALPVGSGALSGDMNALSALLSGCFALGLGLFGIVIFLLFLLDLAISFMSRTLPQMNMLLMGFQVKSIATLAGLPVALALSSGVALRLLRLAIESAPRLVGLPGG